MLDGTSNLIILILTVIPVAVFVVCRTFDHLGMFLD
jgi:hypothetical protein